MIEVEWRDVPGWEGLYKVSTGGVVRSEDRLCKAKAGGTALRQGKELVAVRKAGRYLAVSLSRDGEKKQVPIHDLVAAAFIGPKPPQHQTRHWDDDLNNNVVTNIVYGTAAENSEDMTRNGKRRRGERHSAAKLSPGQVTYIRQTDKLGIHVAEELGVSAGHVSNIRKRKTWKHL